MKKLKKGPQNQDLKDTEVYPAPPSHHIIKCRACNESSKVKTKYTRLCNTCRRDSEYQNLLKGTWKSWAHEPTLGVDPDKGVRLG